MSRPPLPPINFTALAEALLARADELVAQWLPGGVRRGHEYVCGSLSGGEGGSCSVNLTNGRWGDFSTDDKGGDLISLYAAIHMLEPGAAALAVAREEGLESVAGIVSVPNGPAPPPAPPRAPAPPSRPKSEPEGWRSQMPVPDIAPAATFWHYARSADDIIHTAEYRCDGHLLGYVVRFRTSDGGKETLPYTWCVSARDGAAKWHWKTWDEPRPLYYPGGRHPEGRTVIVVEGEIKAEVLQALLDAGAPNVYCVVSWAGGCKAWQKAAWPWVEVSTVLLWPDCDSKREKLTKKEESTLGGNKDAIALAAAAKPYLSIEKQPGMAAMLGIGALLRDSHHCTVSMLPCEKPGVRPDGWDARDAIEIDGWDFDRVLQFLAQATPLLVKAPAESPAAAKAGKAGKGEQRERNSDDGDDGLPWWLEQFVDEKTGSVRMTRKTVITCLRNAPDLVDCLGFNELSGEVSTRQKWPWRPDAGPVVDTDDLRLGDWLSHKYRVPGAPRAALTEAMHTVADSRPFHPVRDYLNGLQHDGRPRAEKWLMYCAQIDPSTLSPQRLKYFQMISRFWLIGMVARVMDPGCKFDYSLVLEGLTGRRKSTMAEVMAGKTYYSDTHFDIGGNKDGFDQLQGLWVYELSEMSALRKADSEQVKAFFSSSSDRYRASYGRYVQNHPRQCVIICTTNKRQYLYDTTGNRRFWPFWIDLPLRIEWFMKWRDQLFAEAVALYRQGGEAGRYAPTLEEEQLYFIPEQELRLVETGVQGELLRLLTRPGAVSGDKGDTMLVNDLCNFVTMPQLIRALGTDVGKSTAQLESQIRGWLDAEGWERKRSPVPIAGSRPYGWIRPAGWPHEPAPPASGHEAPGPSGPANDDDSGQAQAAHSQDEDDLPI